MTTFVLVHGAWYGPWAWERVAPFLHEAGVRTVTPTLTLEGDAGLGTHVQELVTILDQEAAGDGGVVLVGHSYAGLVVRQAADQRPGLVRHVMMIDGWAGGDGESLFSLAPDAFVTVISRSARASAGGRHVPAPQPERFGVTDPEDARVLARRLRPQPLRTFTEATRLSGAVDRIPGTAIFCHPPTFPFEQFGKAVGYRTLPLDGPHDVMSTHPREVARLLIDLHTGR
ncbi:salicylate esterase [[Actinomadura] parvosata subsp. kistnae]|uniref:Alpha/beta hydrolase n=1 Tax=[Actinomadura] parvosata subsp. kistnae TaxID=1909395 RepID=A0A1U9ZZP1_9ACTN|nr:alpha/beta hydrolase [Nonomuraea sp. ATCC 55076]AQZ63433.1 alpha/beta hydrolase [Nonomuraea sp. ATCC 55076]SPL99163.1 salicylate esterase [Actinomadura parvosata subsp. kistnae]